MNPEVESEKISSKDGAEAKPGGINLLSLKGDDYYDRAKVPKAVPKEFPSTETFADILNSDVQSDGKSEPRGLTKYLAGLPSFEDISHSVNRLGRDIYQGTK